MTKHKITKRKNGSLRVQFECIGKSMTKQSFKEESCINGIMSKYAQGKAITNYNSIQGVYGDFSNVTSYDTACNATIQAEEAFAGLPAKTRQKFANNPSELITFVQDEKNRAECVELGLLPYQEPQQIAEKLASQDKVTKVTNVEKIDEK